MIFSKQDFIKQFSQKELNIIIKSIVIWQTFASGDDKNIDRALVILSKHLGSLSQVMNLNPPKRLYRGIAIEAANELGKYEIGELVDFKQKRIAESWSTYKSALSFAESKEWHKNFGNKDLGLVFLMKEPKKQTAILAPPYKTIRWFEELLEENLLKIKVASIKEKDDRVAEDEYLIMADTIKAYLIKKIEL